VVAPARSPNGAQARIIDPELDMQRARLAKQVTFPQLRRLVEWLVPPSRGVGPPMRSVAREIEEAFPAPRDD
jgi:hypothetical protein